MARSSARGFKGFRLRLRTHLVPLSTRAPDFRQYSDLLGWHPAGHCTEAAPAAVDGQPPKRGAPGAGAGGAAPFPLKPLGIGSDGWPTSSSIQSPKHTQPMMVQNLWPKHFFPAGHPDSSDSCGNWGVWAIVLRVPRAIIR